MLIICLVAERRVGKVPERPFDLREGGQRFQNRGAAGVAKDHFGEQDLSGESKTVRRATG